MYLKNDQARTLFPTDPNTSKVLKPPKLQPKFSEDVAGSIWVLVDAVVTNIWQLFIAKMIND